MSSSRGLVFLRLLQLAIGHGPIRYRDLIANPAPGTRTLKARGVGHPPSLDQPTARRLRRRATPLAQVGSSG